MSRLALENICKQFGSSVVVDHVSLEVGDGEFLVLVGPSGCGKSTLLRIVAGLVAPTSGDVRIDGKRVNDLEPRERDAAMVFQNYALYPHMSVRRNLAFPLKMAGIEREAIEKRVAATTSILGLEPFLERKPATLSGGQMQRVALGRAIVRDPKLYLFDEPLSNLDAKLRAEMRAEIVRLQQKLGITTLYVTHDQAEAMTMGTRICVLEKGRVQQIGPPLEVFEHPETTFVASFIGSPAMNLVRGDAKNGHFRSGSLEAPCPHGLSGEVLLGIRPHQVEVGAGMDLPVTHVEQLGSQTHIQVECGGEKLLVTREGHADARAGSKLAIRLPAERLHWFESSSGRRINR
jgi:multiple sugar transport system ATP-binding protein